MRPGRVLPRMMAILSLSVVIRVQRCASGKPTAVLDSRDSLSSDGLGAAGGAICWQIGQARSSARNVRYYPELPPTRIQPRPLNFPQQPSTIDDNDNSGFSTMANSTSGTIKR